MDNIIRLLPDNIANQIAAGEVIQRPASVIKELVENSIDADATKIDIEIKDAGKTLIQVIDNGKGMAPLDAQMAFERHATSKIRTADDLFSLTTKGFRGEALPSISAVSHVTLQTRTADESNGTKIIIEGSKIISVEPTVCPKGANFSIRHLFYNVPARRKFLKQDTTELQHIINEVRNVAAVAPEVNFTLKHNDQTILDLPASSLEQRILDLFGRKRLLGKLLPVSVETPLILLQGFIGSPKYTRKRGAQQYFFANERFMRHSFFHKMVMNAYGNMIPKDEYPDYFLYLTVDPAAIDVNISPTKTEIKFEAESDIGSIIFSVLRKLLMQGASVPTLEFLSEGEERLDIPVSTTLSPTELLEPPTSSAFIQKRSKLNKIPTIDLGKSQLPDLSEWERSYHNFESRRSKINLQELIPSPTPSHSFSSSESLPQESPTLFGEYAVYPYEHAFVIAHLPRAQYHIVFSRLLHEYTGGHLKSAPLLFPVLVELSVRENILLKTYKEEFLKLGFDLSDMGSGTYSINAVPSGVTYGTESELLISLLDECNATGKVSSEMICDKLIDRLTRQIIRSSPYSTNPDDVLSLLQELYRLPEHTLTKKGELILSTLSPKELDLRFKSKR